MRNWSATELEFAASVWAVKKNRKLFYGISFVVVGDHRPLNNFESLAAKLNRVQREVDMFSAYTYEPGYRPGTSKGKTDLMSRLPLPNVQVITTQTFD